MAKKIAEKASDAVVKQVEIKHLRSMKDVDSAISDAEAQLAVAEAKVTELKADIAEYKKIKG